MSNRVPGEGCYAQMEREQRWVLRSLPDGLAGPVSIMDLYITGTRLRLRRMESNAEVVYKLGQKVRSEPDKPEVVKLTNMYLSEREHSVLAILDGAEIIKTRWQWSPGERSLAVDEFRGPLAGLIMAEVELQPGVSRLPNPPLVVADVTDDDRFSGGILSGTTAARLASLLVELEVKPSP